VRTGRTRNKWRELTGDCVTRKSKRKWKCSFTKQWYDQCYCMELKHGHW